MSTRDITQALIPDANPTSVFFAKENIREQKELIIRTIQSRRNSHSCCTYLSIGFFLISLALLIAGLALSNQNCNSTTDEDCDTETGSVLSTIGGILTAISFLACCSRMRSNPRRTYSLLTDNEKNNLKYVVEAKQYEEDTDLIEVYKDLEAQDAKFQYSGVRLK